MTTIAYRAGVLASDTQVSYSDTQVLIPDLKLFIAGDYAVGVCGDCRMIPTVKRWFEEHSCSPKKAHDRMWDESFDILAMDRSGKLFTLLADQLYEWPVDFFAIGSGRMLALGAMSAGASAIEAVEAAADHDVYTSRPVQSISVSDLLKSVNSRKGK